MSDRAENTKKLASLLQSLSSEDKLDKVLRALDDCEDEPQGQGCSTKKPSKWFNSTEYTNMQEALHV